MQYITIRNKKYEERLHKWTMDVDVTKSSLAILDLREKIAHIPPTIDDNLVEILKKEGFTPNCYDELGANDDSCFVATVVYGDVNAPEVQALREFRDNVLRKSLAGREFINFYYSGAGKRIAEFIEQYLPSTIPVIRKGLNFLVKTYHTNREVK